MGLAQFDHASGSLVTEYTLELHFIMEVHSAKRRIFNIFLFLISPKSCLGDIFLEVHKHKTCISATTKCRFFPIFSLFSGHSQSRIIYLSCTLLWKFTYFH